MSFEATGQFFGISEEQFQEMVSESTFDSNHRIEVLLSMFQAALDEARDQGTQDEIERHTWRLGFLSGVKFTRIGFAG